MSGNLSGQFSTFQANKYIAANSPNESRWLSALGEVNFAHSCTILLALSDLNFS